jgi:secreted PhoX family phosphatase
VIELAEKRGDHGAETFTWEIFALCGDPANPADEPTYFAGFDPSDVSAISCPDNVTFDQAGNLWIATDGQIGTFNRNDGIFAVPTAGGHRGHVRQFLSGVPGGECASLALTPDDETLFVSIQHPAEGSTIANPTHRWPDGTVPRPTVIAVRKRGHGDKTIGS